MNYEMQVTQRKIHVEVDAMLSLSLNRPIAANSTSRAVSIRITFRQESVFYMALIKR